MSKNYFSSKTFEFLDDIDYVFFIWDNDFTFKYVWQNW